MCYISVVTFLISWQNSIPDHKLNSSHTTQKVSTKVICMQIFRLSAILILCIPIIIYHI